MKRMGWALFAVLASAACSSTVGEPSGGGGHGTASPPGTCDVWVTCNFPADGGTSETCFGTEWRLYMDGSWTHDTNFTCTWDLVAPRPKCMVTQGIVPAPCSVDLSSAKGCDRTLQPGNGLTSWDCHF